MENAQKTFDTCEEKMKIPKVIDPSDMVENPDEHANMTYISYFRDYVRIILFLLTGVLLLF